MDEIITRWASDLSKYQKEFQTQAAKVAAWDRLMVDNGDKIQKLYVETHEAERHHAEIERQLTNVEGQQDELASWLDRYEADVDEMFQRQVGHGDSLQGPDQERERTYKLAERLTDRLDGMGKELTTMIEAINDASTTLSKTSKSDDPVSFHTILIFVLLLIVFIAFSYRPCLKQSSYATAMDRRERHCPAVKVGRSREDGYKHWS
jgi:nuclear pore complex protein Nup62